MNENIFETTTICDGVYRIREFGFATCYLVVGKKSALLVDTANGVGNIREEVEKITDLPIVVALTHAHPDHAGGTYFFKEIYLAKADNLFIFKLVLSKFARTAFLMSSPVGKMGLRRRDVCKYPSKTKRLWLEDGQTFDLGGKTVRTLFTPGHSKGSVVFMLEEDGIMFTGDNVNTGLWMFVPGGVSIEEWLVGARKIYDLTDHFIPYCGHDEGLQTKEEIAHLINIGERLLENTLSNTKLFKIRSYPEKDDIKILYRTDKVLKKAKKGEKK